MFEAYRRGLEANKYWLAAAGGALLVALGLWQFSAVAHREVQLQLCVEASGIAERLAQDKAANRDFKQSTRADAFRELIEGRRGVIEDRCVVGTMERFKSRVLFDDPATSETPEQSALFVAFACRRMASRNFSAGAINIFHLQTHPENLTEIDEFKSTMQQIPGCTD